MISVEAWRLSIGSFHSIRVKSLSSKLNDKDWTSITNVSCYILSAALITMLLLIGGVESNPGPTSGISYQ